jgi:hypothetical protein
VIYCRSGTKAVTHGRFAELNRLCSSVRVCHIDVVLDHVDELMNVINVSSNGLQVFLVIKQFLSRQNRVHYQCLNNFRQFSDLPEPFQIAVFR